MNKIISSAQLEGPDVSAKLSALVAEYATGLPYRITMLARAVNRIKRQPSNRLLHAEAISQAHRLRGTAGCYGFAGVGECMRRLEMALRSQDDCPAAGFEPLVWKEIELALTEARLSVDQVNEPGSGPQGIGGSKAYRSQEHNPDKKERSKLEEQALDSLSDARALSPIRVLLIEDDGDYYRFVNHVTNFSAPCQFALEWRCSLRDALACLSEYTPDVILLDLLLPDSEGLNTFASIKDHSPGVPIVILSANEDQQLAIDAVASGAQDYLNKQQVSMESLLRCTRYAIERKRHEESRLRLAAVEDFMGTLAHDLQVPMIGAELVLQGLLAGTLGQLPPEQANAIAALKEGNDRLLGLVKKLLEVYRCESTKMTQSCQSMNLPELISSCLTDYRLDIESMKLEINIDFAPDLLTIPGNDRMLRVLFVNLIDNAVKFSPPGSKIDIWANNVHESIAVHIRNFGKLIDAEDQTRMFERFWQGVPGKKYVAQTGIGLYLCQRIVTLHKGKINCQSTSDSGTTFTVVLPAAPG